MRDVKRWPILAALGTFLVGGGVAVVRGILSEAYMGRAQAWALGNTISYYVGTSTWAAVMFAVLNFVTVLLIGYYLWQVGQVWQMPRILLPFSSDFSGGVCMAVGLSGLLCGLYGAREFSESNA